jgi:hypothetical protein
MKNTRAGDLIAKFPTALTWSGSGNAEKFRQLMFVIKQILLAYRLSGLLPDGYIATGRLQMQQWLIWG